MPGTHATQEWAPSWAPRALRSLGGWSSSGSENRKPKSLARTHGGRGKGFGASELLFASRQPPDPGAKTRARVVGRPHPAGSVCAIGDSADATRQTTVSV
jgi:hypothetical protein